EKLDKSELEKMSRPQITFPKLGTDPRPEQQVMPLETERQKKMFGKIVANKEVPDKMKLSSGSVATADRQSDRDYVSKRVANKFGRSALGLNYSTKEGPVSGALVGAARSKFEDSDDDHLKQLDQWKNKR